MIRPIPYFYSLYLIVTVLALSTTAQPPECTITDLREREDKPVWYELSFVGAENHLYSIYWKDSLSQSQAWDPVEYPSVNDDILLNPDATFTFIDKGIDPQMDGVAPGETETGRFYKVVARKPVARNIIIIIADGMHLEHEIAASRYRYGTDKGLAWHSFPYTAYVTTWDVNTYNRYAWNANASFFDEQFFVYTLGYDPSQGGSAPYPSDASGQETYFLTSLGDGGDYLTFPATDSAAAATAIATGCKTEEGNISWRRDDPDDGMLATIAEQMRAQFGSSIGVVSTMPFNHATPAAFVSHNRSRNNYYTGLDNDTAEGIADEIITSVKPDIVIGGGHPLLSNPDWDVTEGYISQQLYTQLQQSAEYIFVERQTGIDAQVSLAEAANNAVDQQKKLFGLFGGPKGYFEPQLAADSPGAPQVIRSTVENPTLSNAALAALTVAGRDNDGFFLLIEQGDVDTANHYNDFKWMIASMWDLEEAVKQVVAFVDRPDDSIDWSNTLLVITSDHANSYMRLSNDPPLEKGNLPVQQGYAYAYRYPDGEVSYRTNAHTNELVTFYAKGDAAVCLNAYKGTWYPNTDIIDNTQIYRIIKDAVGLDE